MAFHRPISILFLVLLHLTLGVMQGKATEENQLNRPNIILCMADDQGFGDVGYYGNPIPSTPHLDAMASESLRFDRFYAAAPVCSPTRGSVMTGRHPNRFGCFKWGYELRPEEITVAEVLQSAGYTTGHFGKWHLGSVRADGSNNPGASGFDHWLSAPNFYDNDPIMSREGVAVPIEGESSMIAVDAALEFIENATQQDQPFLAVIWFGSPHNPHKATPGTRSPYSDLPDNLREYYGEITGIDNAMGHLRASLRDREIAENTLVWYTSDNGPQGPEGRGLGSSGGLRGRKGTVWEGGLRVPTIIEWPAAIPEPRTTSLVSGTVDIFPTVLELAQAENPDPDRPLDGVSLVPLIHGKSQSRSKPLGFWDYQARGRSTPSARIMAELYQAQQAGDPEPILPPPPTEPAEGLISDFVASKTLKGHAAWIDGPYKLHRQPEQDGSVVFELYNLETDPAETQDLATKAPELVESLSESLADWQGSVVQSLRGDDYRKSTGN